MKKILSLTLLLLAAMMTTATFTACGDDDDDKTETPAEKAAGIYTGTDQVTIGGQWTYTSSADYTITANADGSINLTIGTETYENTLMGNITQGLKYKERTTGAL